LHPDQHVPADVPGRWGELRRPADHPRLRGASPLEGPFTTTETPATVIVAGVVVCGAALDSPGTLTTRREVLGTLGTLRHALSNRLRHRGQHIAAAELRHRNGHDLLVADRVPVADRRTLREGRGVEPRDVVDLREPLAALIGLREGNPTPDHDRLIALLLGLVDDQRILRGALGLLDEAGELWIPQRLRATNGRGVVLHELAQLLAT